MKDFKEIISIIFIIEREYKYFSYYQCIKIKLILFNKRLTLIIYVNIFSIQ